MKIPNELSVIYTAAKDEIVTLNMWNRTGGNVANCTIKSTREVFNDKSLMVEGCPNKFPDIVHIIELKNGEQIFACADGTLDYEIVQ